MDKRVILKHLENYLQTQGVSANDLARKSGINVSYLSAMRNGKDTAVVNGNPVKIQDKWWEKLAKFTGLSVEKEYWKFIPTKEAVRILATLEDAKKYGYTNLIVGETGCGKTYVANVFRRNNLKDTYMVTVGSSDNIGDLVDKVVEALKINTGRTRSKKIRDIVKHLSRIQFEGGKPMLIFDEAEYMKQSALCAMKEFYDSLNGVCALVLIGTSQIQENLDRLRRRNKAGIPQFYRRIKYGIRKLPNVDRLFNDFLQGINDKGLIRLLREHCDNYGELHDVLVPAKREADRTGNELSESFVRMLFEFEN